MTIFNPLKDNEAEITPVEFERLVLKYLRDVDPNVEILHNQYIDAHDGKYQIDLYAKFKKLDLDFKVLIECKKYKSSIKREVVTTLHSKVQSIGAHKGVIFATNTYQRGAIEYASKHGIGLISVIGGEVRTELRSLPPSFYGNDFYKDSTGYQGFFVRLGSNNESITVQNISNNLKEILS